MTAQTSIKLKGLHPETLMTEMLMGMQRKNWEMDLMPIVRNPKPQTQAMNLISVGNTEPDLDGADISIDMTTACRMSFIAPTRAGKSYLMMAIASMCYHSGYMLSVLNDIRNEWVMADMPVGIKYHKWVHPNFEPNGIPVVPVIPKFIDDILNTKHPEIKPFQFDLSQVNEIDISTVLGIDTAMAKDQYSNAFSLIWDSHKKKGGNMSFKEFFDAVNFKDQFKEATFGMHSEVTRKALLSRLIRIRMNSFFGSDLKIDMKKIMMDNDILVMSTQNYDDVDPNALYVYLAILQRQQKKIKINSSHLMKKRLIQIADETSWIAPGRRETSAKTECKETIQRGAAYGIYQMFGLQTADPEVVDKMVLSQSKYIFVNKYTDGYDINRIARSMNMPMKEREFLKENVSKLPEFDNGQRAWYLLEKGKKPVEFYPYAPLCNFEAKKYK